MTRVGRATRAGPPHAEEGPMNYFLTDDQKMIKELAAQIAQEKIAPIAAELDESGEFPWEIVKILGQSDLFRVFIPDEYEGLGGGIFEMCIVVEELSKVCGGIALGYAASGLGTIPIILLRQRRAEEEVAAPARLGRDPRRLRADRGGRGQRRRPRSRPTAKPDGDSYVITGTKQWITNGGEADDLHGRSPDRPRRAACAARRPSSSRRARPGSTSARRRTRWASGPRRRASSSSTTAGSRSRTSSARRAWASSWP